MGLQILYSIEFGEPNADGGEVLAPGFGEKFPKEPDLQAEGHSTYPCAAGE